MWCYWQSVWDHRVPETVYVRVAVNYPSAAANIKIQGRLLAGPWSPDAHLGWGCSGSRPSPAYQPSFIWPRSCW